MHIISKIVLTSALIQPKHHLKQLYPLQNFDGVALDIWKGS